jgi:hypothetical protein
MNILRLLLVRAVGYVSIRSFYSLWIRASGVTMVLFVANLSAASSWFVTTGLIVILAILLVGGILLLVLGIRDLIRDFRRFLRPRSEKRSVS